MARKKKWIKSAIKHPGKLKRAAKRAGALKKDGTIKVSWLRERAAKGDRAARLALTLRKMKRRKKKRS